MVILRATRKVLRSLPQSAVEVYVSDTALGDWYVNRMVVDRQPLLLMVSALSLLAVLTPARAVRTLPDRFPGLIADRLRRLGVDWHLIGREMEAMLTVRVGTTKDRSVVGTMVDFAKMIPYDLPEDGWDASSLRSAEESLAETPCRASRSFQEVIFPGKATIQLLRAKWST